MTYRVKVILDQFDKRHGDSSETFDLDAKGVLLLGMENVTDSLARAFRNGIGSQVSFTITLLVSPLALPEKKNG